MKKTMILGSVLAATLVAPLSFAGSALCGEGNEIFEGDWQTDGWSGLSQMDITSTCYSDESGPLSIIRIDYDVWHSRYGVADHVVRVETGDLKAYFGKIRYTIKNPESLPTNYLESSTMNTEDGTMSDSEGWYRIGTRGGSIDVN